jgi:diacylglycerol kinase family enzyme
MTAGGTVDVILNVRAGAGHDASIATTLAGVFLAEGETARIISADPGKDDLTGLARHAAEAGARAVVAAGGDGTVSCVAAGLAGTQTPLGVIPLGTLNHFAKDAGIPRSMQEAVRAIVAAHVTTVDVGDVNGRTFINTSSLGLYPQLVQSRARHQRNGQRKWAALLLASLDVLRHYSFVKVRLTTGDRRLVRRTPLVMIGNNRYEMQTLAVGSRSSLAKGQLSVYITHQGGPLALAGLAARAVFSRLNVARDLDVLIVEEIQIETRSRSVLVATDGEVTTMAMPLHYRIRPGALRVIVPAPPPGMS